MSGCRWPRFRSAHGVVPHAESQAFGAKARGALAYEADGNGSMMLKQHAILAHLKRDALPEGFEENVRRHFATPRGWPGRRRS